MSDPLDFDGLVEMGARVLAHNAGDDDMCWALYADDARAILSAVLPHVLAGPREGLRPFGVMADQVDEWAKGTQARVDFSFSAGDLRRARTALARIDKLTEGMSREGETG